MYAGHFGLGRNPFNPLSPAPPYASRELQEALTHFQFAQKNREGFFLLVGEVGTGKSTAIRAILDALGKTTPVAVVRHTSLDARELLEEVVRRFGLEPRNVSTKPVLLAQFEHFLAAFAETAPPVLIIDEAHLLSHAALEEVRLLSNLKHGDRPLLQIVLVGQPEIQNRLRQHRLRPLRQRIAVRYIVGALSREETREYIAHRLKAAGSVDPDRIFSPAAADAVHQLAEGLPREINVIAGQAMMNAYLESSPVVKPRHVRTTKQDYGFEGVRVERKVEPRERVREMRETRETHPVVPPRPVPPRPVPPRPVTKAVASESARRNPVPSAQQRRNDLPLQLELPTRPASRAQRTREDLDLTTDAAFPRRGMGGLVVAVALLAAFGLAFVLYTRTDAVVGLPEPPRPSPTAPSALDLASLVPAPPPDASVTTAPAEPETPKTVAVEPESDPPERAVMPVPEKPKEVAPRPAAAGGASGLPTSASSRAGSAADRLELGARLARSGKLKDAIAAFREAVELNPKYTDALYNLGVSLLENGQAREAAEALRSATAISPNDALAQRSLGIALAQSGQLPEAATALRRAVKLSPQDDFALRHLASVLRQSGDIDGTIDAMNRAVGLKPNDPAIHQELGFAYRAVGRLPEATGAFQRAIDLDQNLALAHYSLGITLLEMGYPRDGEREIAEARRLGYDPRQASEH